jgi:hypothetical protein
MRIEDDGEDDVVLKSAFSAQTTKVKPPVESAARAATSLPSPVCPVSVTRTSVASSP